MKVKLFYSPNTASPTDVPYSQGWNMCILKQSSVISLYYSTCHIYFPMLTFYYPCKAEHSHWHSLTYATKDIGPNRILKDGWLGLIAAYANKVQVLLFPPDGPDLEGSVCSFPTYTHDSISPHCNGLNNNSRSVLFLLMQTDKIWILFIFIYPTNIYRWWQWPGKEVQGYNR